MIMITRIIISKCSRAAIGDNKGWDNYGYSTCTQGSQGPQNLSSLKSCFLFYNHQKWFHNEMPCNKTVKNIQIDPQTTEIFVVKIHFSSPLCVPNSKIVNFLFIFLYQ